MLEIFSQLLKIFYHSYVFIQVDGNITEGSMR